MDPVTDWLPVGETTDVRDVPGTEPVGELG